LQALGDDWLESGRSAVLRVPGVIVSGEFNCLLNPSKLQTVQRENVFEKF
jgi:hypothetical protein